jgi:hypothetical protein
VNLLAHLLRLHVPSPLKQEVLAALFEATAAAFAEPIPDLDGLPFEERLTRYAEFTHDAVMRAIADGRDLPAIERRLHAGAYGLGRRLRRLLGVDQTDTAQVMAVGRTLYGVIGIDLRGTSDGEVTVGNCYFSRFYAPETCRVISALDAGLFAGLSDGGQLVFSQRITEGHPCCRARLFAREDSP